MKVKEIIKVLNGLEQDKEILLGSDEELNSMFQNLEVNYLTDLKKYVIFGLSGSEVENA